MYFEGYNRNVERSQSLCEKNPLCGASVVMREKGDVMDTVPDSRSFVLNFIVAAVWYRT